MLSLKHKNLLSNIDYLKTKLDLYLSYYEKGLEQYSIDLSLLEEFNPTIGSKIYTIDDMLNIPIDDVSLEFKKLYRKITFKTHPDKVNESIKNNMYVEAVTSVKYNNWFDLISIAKKLDLELPIVSEEQIEWLTLLVSILEKKLDIIKNSNGWQYYMKTKEERKVYLERKLDEKT